jgi:hypothetical protein
VKEFFVGLLVLLVLLVMSAIGVFLLPLIVALGFFLQSMISIAVLIFGVWLVGKVTIWAIEYTKKGKE